MKKLTLRQALKQLGYTVVQYSKNYNFRSGFMTKDEQLYYFSYSDLRDVRPTLLVRTADPTILDRKGKYADYRGGHNTYPSTHGFYISEPRIKCDFNSN